MLKRLKILGARLSLGALLWGGCESKDTTTPPPTAEASPKGAAQASQSFNEKDAGIINISTQAAPPPLPPVPAPAPRTKRGPGPVALDKPTHPIMAYGWAETTASALVLVHRQEMLGIDCKQAEWPFCYRWSAVVRSDAAQSTRLLVDCDTPHAVTIKGIAASATAPTAAVMWHEGIIAGDEGRLVVSWLDDATASGTDTTLWATPEAHDGEGAIAALLNGQFVACWTEDSQALSCAPLEPNKPLGSSTTTHTTLPGERLRHITLAPSATSPDSALLLWISGGHLQACRLRRGGCAETWLISGGDEVATKPLWVRAGPDGYLVLWRSAKTQAWIGRRVNEGGAPIGSGLSMLGEGEVTGITLGDHGFWISQSFSEPRPASETSPKEPTQGTQTIRWPFALDQVPDMAVKHPLLPRFFLTESGAVSIQVDKAAGLHIFHWLPFPMFEAPLTTAPP